MVATTRRPKGFWRSDVAVRELVAYIGGERDSASVARRLGCSREMVRKAASDLRRDLRVGWAAGRLAPGAALALLGLNREAVELLDRADRNREAARRGV